MLRKVSGAVSDLVTMFRRLGGAVSDWCCVWDSYGAVSD